MRRWWIASAALCGCTALNPLFGDVAEGSAERGEGEGTSAGKSTEESGEAGTSVGSTAGSSSSSASVGESSTGVVTTHATSESGGSCSVPEVIDVVIDVMPPPNADPTCGSVWMSPQGPLSTSTTGISVAECTCMCPGEPIPGSTVSIAGVDIPPLPPCGYLMAWQVATDAGCEWAGVAAFGSSQPEWIVSRSPFVPPSVFGGLDVALNRDDACEIGTCDGTGTYELEFTGAPSDNKIKMDDDPKRMVLPFNAQLPYVVDDVSSVLDESCVSHLAWTATYDP